MRPFLLIPVLLLLAGEGLWAGDPLLFRPETGGFFFFPGYDPVPRGVSAGQDLVLNYGDWSFLLERGFIPSGRTLLQLYFDSRRKEGHEAGTLVRDAPRPPEEGMEFSRGFMGGTLIFSPVRPDRIIRLADRKTEIHLSEKPGGILLFFEAGGEFFWLGNGSAFYCYDRDGLCLVRYNLAGTALFSAADDEGWLYLCFTDGTLGALPPTGPDGEAVGIDRTFDAAELILSCYGEAESLVERSYAGEGELFDQWILKACEALFRNDPLDRELGEFLRSLKD